MSCSYQSAAVSHRRSASPARAMAAAVDPRDFGRGPRWTVEPDRSSNRISDDLRLFATTFAGGFLFVSLLIA